MEAGRTYVPDPPSGPPPPPPPRPAGRYPDWPLWFPLAGLASGLAAAALVLGVVQGALNSAGANARTDSPGFNILGTALIDLFVVAACVIVAALSARPRLWQFGLRRSPLARAAGTVAGGAVVFIAFEGAYQAIVHPHNPQKVVQDIGANLSTTLLILGAVVVVGLAPVCEELFFRGFLYRALRLRMGMWLAALVDGAVFGLVHGYLIIVPVLAFLGFVFCIVYEYTGSIFPTIAMHSLNNLVAYGTTAKHGWPPALAVGGLVLLGCLLIPQLLEPSPEPLPA